MVASPPPPSDPAGCTRSSILPRNVTTSTSELEQHLLATLDGIDEPIAIGSSIRDRDGRILDFRFEYMNPAAARWAGMERESLIGLITADLLPEFRAGGYFDSLREVVETGRPYFREGASVAGTAGGSWVGGLYDLRAVRLGDGYLITWRQRTASPQPG
jgi:PAS domain-containing protein